MPVIELIDSHIHLDDDRFDADRELVLARAVENGVTTMVVPATTSQRWPKLQAICDSHAGVIPAFGLHPVFLHEHSESDLDKLETLVTTTSCCAIGECGLDRHISEPGLDYLVDKDSHRNHHHDRHELNFEKQVYYFEAQLEIAARVNLPLIVHARKAVEDVILSIKKCSPTRGVIHSYNGSLQQATRLIEMGYRLSFGGAATYLRARKIRRLIELLPGDSLMIETDAPDQTGFAHQHQRNEPAYLTEVLETVAALRGEKPATIAEQCNQNARDLFNLG